MESSGPSSSKRARSDDHEAAAAAPSKSSKAAKRAKLLALQQEKGGIEAMVTPQNAVAHPFEALAEDAAETPFEAYRDIEPLLFRLTTLLGKTKANVKLYDPFYAAGSVVVHLKKLGFENVYNKNEDFYAAVREGAVPDFDILITNPPFSGDHMKRTLDFALRCGKPFLLLLPEFVEEKKYYQKYLQRVEEGTAGVGGAQSSDTIANASSSSSSSSSNSKPKAAAPIRLSKPVYLGPTRRPYQFSAPGRDLDGVKPFIERTHHTELPFQVFACKFQCVWYLQLGQHRDVIVPWWMKKYEGQQANCTVSETSAVDLPQLSKAAKLKAQQQQQQQQVGEIAPSSSAIAPSDAAKPFAAAAAAAGGADQMSRNAWRKKLSRQRKAAAKAALKAGGSK